MSRPAGGRGQALLLGLLSAIGPISVDMYLPAFGTIAADLRTDIGTIQLSMAAYFLGLGGGQLFYGPWSDRAGRKPPILFGLAVFVAGSLVCATAGSAGVLIAGRFVQAIGICAILAVMRAIVRDQYRGADAAHLMARIMLIVSVSPLLAPLGGSAIIALAGWRPIFWLLAALATALLLLTICSLPETHAPARPAGPVLRTCRELLVDPGYRRCLVLLAAAQAGASVYLAGSSFVYISVLGFSPVAFSIAFAINAAAMIGVAQYNRRLIVRFGIPRVLLIGTGTGAAAMTLAVVAYCTSAALFVPAFLLYFASFGLVMGPVSVLALEDHADKAGTGGALLGTAQFTTGAIAAMLAGAAFDGSAGPVVFVMFAAATVALGMAMRVALSARRD